MPVERSAGAVIFKEERGKIYYLLLHYPGASHRSKKDYWDFPKGHLEKGESEKEAAKREIEEETGLKEIEFIDGFQETIKYFFKWKKKNVLKFVTFFLAKTKTKKVQISPEHIGYEFLPYEKAKERLTFENAKEILKKAHYFLLKKKQ